MALIRLWQQFLDRTTMYRVVIYALLAITAAAFVASFLGYLFFSPLALGLSLLVTVGAALAAHEGALRLSGAPSNRESSLITALLVFLIVTPTTAVSELVIVAAIAAGAVFLKYLVRWRLRHIFNPAALALFAAGLFGYFGVEWWVGSRYLFPVVLLAGLAVLLKTRRTELAFVYIAVSTLVVLAVSATPSTLGEVLFLHFFSWPTLFFAAFMLTEPLSLPGTRVHQNIYAGIAALLSSVPFTLGPLHGTPELALLVANLYTQIVDQPARLRLILATKTRVGGDTVEYGFTVPRPIDFAPGQYFEWTLPHAHADKRGIRRYFTASSAPEGEHLAFAVRHVTPGSSFKAALETMEAGDVLYATQRAGDFVLREGTVPPVFIAGGLGITPFISMLRSAAMTGSPLTATLFYCNKTAHDVAYHDELTRFVQTGLRRIDVVQDGAGAPAGSVVGYLTAAIVAAQVPDYLVTTFYLSGPPGLVSSYAKLLRSMGVPRKQIVTDYFPGLA